MAPPSLKYVSVFIFELNCTRPFWTWFTSRLQLYLHSVFLLSSLGVLAGAKANLLWLGSHFLCSMYWCMYLLSDCFLIRSPDKEQALRYSHCQDCALLLYSDVLPQNYPEWEFSWVSLSQHLAWLPLVLPPLSFSLLFYKLRRQVARRNGQGLQTWSHALACHSWFLVWCCGRTSVLL